MSPSRRPLLFLLFFISGFCSLVYQLVWTRMAFASFGIITPVLSVVISVFMLGLSVGAWAGGKWIGVLTRKTGLSAASFYALSEFIIGLGAFAVPGLFAMGEHSLLSTGGSDSLTYLSLSALVLAISILPWCLFMGATFPLMMAYVRERDPLSSESFSFLYLANVLGAMAGSLAAAVVLVEIFGFHDTLHIAAAGNFVIAVISFWLGQTQRITARTSAEAKETTSTPQMTSVAPTQAGRGAFIKWILFTTGFMAMAMEVVWMRAFAPVLMTQVYSFAMVVATYLGATFLGSWLYRRALQRRQVRSTAELISFLCIASLLPIVATGACFELGKMTGVLYGNPFGIALLLASICPFCAILGYLTPGLVDEYSGGSPKVAGSAYAVNVLGCILGPLFASYLLLPRMSERHALILLGLPFFGFFWSCRMQIPAQRRLGFGAVAAVVLVVSIFGARGFEDYFFKPGVHAEVRRDYAASVVSVGEGLHKRLLVNGVGMTRLTPITKFMAHLPLAFHKGTPQSALIVCFGMGTTYRSALSWNVETTAVELVPSVKQAFGFYFVDAEKFVHDPKGRIVIDDGRRYLKRTQQKYDVIVVDPPPPVEAAGSSLLYSKEFYDVAKQHLNTNGILQTWVPQNITVAAAALRSVCESFPHVRYFSSVEKWGLHVLASMEPIDTCSAAELASRMPEAGKRDLLEWSSSQDLPGYLNTVLSQEYPLQELLNLNPGMRITDDQAYNEYFLLRKWGLWR